MTRKVNKLTGLILPVLLLAACSAEKLAHKTFDKGEYNSAIDKYSKILSKNPSNPEANYFTAEAYRRSNRPGDAANFYEKAIKNGIENDSVKINYAYSLKANGNYEEAKKIIEDYLINAKDEYLIKVANEQADGLARLDEIRSIQNYYKVKNHSVNTPNTEYSPVYTDGYLYFTSNRENSKVYKATGTGYTNIYRVKTQGANIDDASMEKLDEAINSIDKNEGTITFTPDGKTMVFARGNGDKRKSRADVDLYISTLRNGKWTAPRMLNTAVNDPSAWESTPAFSRDGRTLYFASNRAGGYGGVDIYSARMNSRGRFSEAKNVGPEINTTGNDLFPYVSDDGHLYFASDGHPGFGMLDLFVAKRINGQIKIENLGEPMNSKADDFGIFLFKADRGFFTSNRDGGKGDDDIYTFINEDPNLKIVNYYLEGVTKTKDENDKEIILRNVIVKLLDYNGEILDETETGLDGKFRFRVYEHEHYTLLGEKKDSKVKYLTTRVTFNTVGRAVNRDTLTQMVTDIVYDTLIVLEKEELNKVFVVDNIYYDLDAFDIRPDAGIELDKLALLLSDNPEIKIELSSHTDSRAPDAYNLKLSQRRAKSAVSYLVQQGIDPTRLVAKGYGESKPFRITEFNGRDILLTENYINSFESEEKQEELHQLNRRTEFKILEITNIGTQINEDDIEDDFFKEDGDN